jgi:tetratricopeptide (TPR) repeat protein
MSDKEKDQQEPQEEKKRAGKGSQSNFGDTGDLQTRLEIFFENYQKPIVTVVSLLVIAIVGYFGYTNFILKPMEERAAEELFRAEQYFERDSLELALYGRPGEFTGFLDIAEDYRRTSSGKLAHYYSGIILLHLEYYEDAISYLRVARNSSKLVEPLRLGAIGDAYSQLGNYAEATRYYERAAKNQSNDFTSPLFYKKAGLVYEHTGDYSKALNMYKQIERYHKDSEQGNDIEKYVARAKAKLNN